MTGDQECYPCPAGTYSLGGGARFDDWEKIPDGFSVTNEPFRMPSFREYGDRGSPVNCSRSGWVPKVKHIEASPDDCSSSLVYTASLVKAGSVTFQYQYTDRDIIFTFQVQNSECQTYRDRNSDRFPKRTDEKQWKEMTVNLKSGMNVIMWRIMGLHRRSSAIKKPVLIKSIEIDGLAFTSQCAKCKAGTHSSQPGSSLCEECPRDTMSAKGAASCTACDATTYADPGSIACLSRPICTEKDYYSVYTPCDKNKQTRKEFSWIEPKVCSETINGAATLPPFPEKENCPPCNPGMHMLTNGTCAFCPDTLVSNGTQECRSCPASTAPEKSLIFDWWNNIPEDSGFSTSCLTTSDTGCRGNNDAWQPAVEFIETNGGFSDDSYLVLSLDVDGFKGDKRAKRTAAPVAHLTFVFESNCADQCSFFFMQQKPLHETALINTWQGKQPRQIYTYTIVDNSPVTFIWAFQKFSWDADSEEEDPNAGIRTIRRMNDYVRIHSVNVTNTLNGGSTECRPCPKGTDQHGCVPCPKGQYVDTASYQCTPCPKGTVTHGINPWGRESCVPCGEGLKATDGSECVSACSYTSPDGREYDFTALPAFQTVSGSRLFTGNGVQFYHSFNISLCGDSNTMPAQCMPNITVPDDDGDSTNQSDAGIRSRGQEVSDYDVDELTKVSSLICRLTLLPPMPGEDGTALSVQPVSLGDSLVKITTNSSELKMAEKLKEEGFHLTDDTMDVHFVYESNAVTEACSEGRTTIITLHCDASQQGNGTIELPPSCADGTCDGCNYHFVWHARQACPLCKNEDFQIVPGECVDGEQIVHKIPPSHCVFLEDSKQIQYRQACSIKWPLWLTIIVWVVPVVVGLAIILIVTLVYCWLKNRRLEYKYMKLVEGKGGSGELPAAETCGLDDDDEEDDDESHDLRQFDAVQFKNRGKTSKLFGKLKGSLSKKDDSHFDIQLSDKTPLT